MLLACFIFVLYIYSTLNCEKYRYSNCVNRLIKNGDVSLLTILYTTAYLLCNIYIHTYYLLLFTYVFNN